MGKNIGISDRDRRFVQRWTAFRAKGRIRYTLGRGVLLGLGLFAVWLLVTIIEIALSEFKLAMYQQHPWDYLGKSCVIWAVCYQIIGVVLANGMWTKKEEKLQYLS